MKVLRIQYTIYNTIYKLINIVNRYRGGQMFLCIIVNLNIE